MLKVLLKFDLLLVMERMQTSVHAPEGGHALRRSLQLRGGFRRCLSALHRQQTGDQLQTVKKAVVEFLRQHVLALQELALLAE